MPSPSHDQIRKTLAVGGLGIAAVISARALTKPLAGGPRRLIDWDRVAAAARSRAEPKTAAGRLTRAQLQQASGRYDEFAHEVCDWMPEVLGAPLEHFPAFTALDRSGFIEVNVGTMRRVIAPLEEARAALADTRLTAFSRNVSDHYIGEVFGILARRVLGQYDPVLHLETSPAARSALPDPALYLVEPNLVAFEREQSVPGDALRRWIILHEMTHAWQFGDHPWLARHLCQTIETVIGSGVVTQEDGSRRLKRNSEVIGRMPQLMGNQLRVIQEVQALMSVLEGYANYLMNTVGRRQLPRFDELQTAFKRRGERRPPLERLIFTLTGMRMKMRQYAVGERFCVAVVEKASLETLNRVWTSADAMPSPAEIREPALWLARVG